ncbi:MULTISPECIES: SDH family Clp fold serine proteinase [Erysipelotrichaceae]|uniref:SDH family Clp fold serine proteinase n=1 Tax=Erysipelotrichaceae TaxID=128827 RepID=UPI002491BC6E|nr:MULTISPECIES: hypothetical protein [Erysipelotrichaceae]
MNEMGNYPNAFDVVRKKYIKKLSDLTGRNTIVYYSGWLQHPDGDSSIDDSDMEGFMNAVNELDCTKGLDLVLHTPGGSPTAAEAIVNYLKDKFQKDIRVIVPQLSMSAGTMIACSAKEIVMGRQSSLGPIDPQFNGIPAYNIISEFNDAKKDLAEDPTTANYWAIILQQYPAAFLKTCYDAISLSSTLAEEWLKDNMLKNNQSAVNGIVEFLNSRDTNHDHGRHFNYKKCCDIGLNISLLEADQEFQDAVLALHHSLMITFQGTNAVKIIENQNGNAYIIGLK